MRRAWEWLIAWVWAVIDWTVTRLSPAPEVETPAPTEQPEPQRRFATFSAPEPMMAPGDLFYLLLENGDTLGLEDGTGELLLESSDLSEDEDEERRRRRTHQQVRRRRG